MTRNITLLALTMSLLIVISHVSDAQAGRFRRWRQTQVSVQSSTVPTQYAPATQERRDFGIRVPVSSAPSRQVPPRNWSSAPQRLSDLGKWPPYY